MKATNYFFKQMVYINTIVLMLVLSTITFNAYSQTITKDSFVETEILHVNDYIKRIYVNSQDNIFVLSITKIFRSLDGYNFSLSYDLDDYITSGGIDENDVLYFSGHWNKMLKSYNNGETWVQFQGEAGFSSDMYIWSPQLIYSSQLTGIDLRRSTDGCNTFEQIYYGTNHYGIINKLSMFRDDHICLGITSTGSDNSGGIFVSENYGNDFNFIGLNAHYINDCCYAPNGDIWIAASSVKNEKKTLGRIRYEDREFAYLESISEPSDYSAIYVDKKGQVFFADNVLMLTRDGVSHDTLYVGNEEIINIVADNQGRILFTSGNYDIKRTVEPIAITEFQYDSPTDLVIDEAIDNELHLIWEAPSSGFPPFEYEILCDGVKIATAHSSQTEITLDVSGFNGDYCFNVVAVYQDNTPSEMSNTICLNVIGVNDYSNTINVYPNPFEDIVFIDDVQNSTISIYDINGKLVYNKKVPTDKLSIETDTWPKGIYIISIKDENCVKSIKMIKR